MAVQIPKVDRFQPQQTPSVGRSELNAPNAAAIAQPQMNAVLSIAEQQTKYIQKQEDNAIDTAAKAAANDYHVYLNKELANARQYKGDPTFIYNQFDENSTKRYEEILNKNPNLSERGKAAVSAQLSEVATRYQLQKDTAYAAQYYDYDLGVTKASSKLKSQDISNLAGYIDPKNPKSFGAIDALINGISTDWNVHGEKFSAVVRDQNGQWVTSDPIKIEIGKDVSDGIVDAINVLNNSGRTDLADAMYARYHNYIDKSKKDNVAKSIKDTETDIKIENLAAQSYGKGPDQISKMIDKEFANKPEAKKKAYAEIDSRQRQLDNMKDRVAENNFKYLANQLFQQQNGPNPFNKVYDMEKDPKYKALLPTLKPNDRKNLHGLIVAPKDSNPNAVANYLNALKNDQLAGMPPEELVKLKGGLSKADGKNLETLWKRYNSPKTSAEEIRSMNDLMGNLDDQLQQVGYVKKITRDDGSTAGYSDKDQAKITAAINELTEQLDKLPPNLSYADRKKVLIEFAAKKKAAQAFTENKGWNLFGGSTTPPSASAPFANTETLADKESKSEAVRRFFRLNKRGPKDTKELEDFLKNEKQ